MPFGARIKKISLRRSCSERLLSASLKNKDFTTIGYFSWNQIQYDMKIIKARQTKESLFTACVPIFPKSESNSI